MPIVLTSVRLFKMRFGEYNSKLIQDVLLVALPLSYCGILKSLLAWQRPTLTGGEPPTTIGAEKLNFRVRNGNGCDLLAIATKLFEQDIIYYNDFFIFCKRKFFIPSKLDNLKKYY
jgi:hypothetical protein